MPTPQPFPPSWGLTPLETAYLNALRPGAPVSMEHFTALHKAPVPPHRVRKTLANLRRKLDPLNIEINADWGKGWTLDRAARMRLTELVKASV